MFGLGSKKVSAPSEMAHHFETYVRFNSASRAIHRLVSTGRISKADAIRLWKEADRDERKRVSVKWPGLSMVLRDAEDFQAGYLSGPEDDV
jgi:hypothetical protein